MASALARIGFLQRRKDRDRSGRPCYLLSVTNTIGTVCVTCSKGPVVALPLAMITSGASATISAACLRKVALSGPNRTSI